VPQTSTRELPDDWDNITDQSQRRPGGNNYALHVVIPPAKTERTDPCNDEATGYTGDHKYSEQGPSDPSPVKDRK
jgi:hypothetical protein